MSSRHRRGVVLGVVIFALVGFPVARFLTGTLLGGDLSARNGAIIKWVLAALVIGFVVIVEARPIASIGLVRPNLRDVFVGVVTFGVMAISFMLTLQLVETLGFSTGFAEGSAGEATVWTVVIALFASLTAAITEEILIRGYALERIEGMTRSTWFAGTTTAVVFVVLHAGTYGLGGLLVLSPLATLLTVAYVWRRNLFVPIIAHVLLNGIPPIVLLAEQLGGSI